MNFFNFCVERFEFILYEIKKAKIDKNKIVLNNNEASTKVRMEYAVIIEAKTQELEGIKYMIENCLLIILLHVRFYVNNVSGTQRASEMDVEVEELLLMKGKVEEFREGVSSLIGETLVKVIKMDPSTDVLFFMAKKVMHALKIELVVQN